MCRDNDLDCYEPKARDIVIRVRDIFDEMKDANPRWLPGLLIEEMYNHDLITTEQFDRLNSEIGL